MVCLIDPVGDVYACPFAIHENFLAGNVREPGGFEAVWRSSELFASLRKADSGGACRSCGFYDSCRGGCMAAKFFIGLPLDGPDPECVRGRGEAALAAAAPAPRPAADHSHRKVPVTIGRRRPPRETVTRVRLPVSPASPFPVPVPASGGTFAATEASAADMVPPGFRLRPDPATRLVADGRAPVGGSPVRGHQRRLDDSGDRRPYRRHRPV
ncbi:MAG TPA: SPASM domain-containing protein [Streptosporangiaceae bacterium]